MTTFAKVRTAIFIDTVYLEFPENKTSYFKAILKDDTGSICKVLETMLSINHQKFSWEGLNDLPYGKYTMELYNAGNEMQLNMIKRV